MTKKFIYGVCYTGLALVFQQGAFANETTAPSEAISLEEITVTARRRTENLKDVPDSITVLNSGTIENAGVTSVDGVAALTSNLNYMNYEQPGVVAVSIRGISQLRIGQASVAFVVDGVTVYNPQEFSQELYDIQQIEVLKGPQGALYGINSIGGAINITTKQPTNELEGMIKLGYAEGNDRKAFATLSGPIAEDKVLFRVSANYRKADGLLNDILDRNADFREEYGVRGKLLFNLNDKLSLDLRANYSYLDAGAFYFQPEQHLFPGDGAILGEINADAPEFSKRKVKGTSAKLSYDMDFARLDLISAWTKLASHGLQDGDTLALSGLEFTEDNSARTLVQEVRLTSPDDQRFRWILGGLYMHFKRETDVHVLLNLNGPFNGGAGVPSEKLLVDVAQTLDDLKNNIYAVFGQANYDIMDDLELTMALRYDQDDAKITRIDGVPQSDSFKSLQPKVSLAYHVTEDAMTYATFSKGFRSGGFNSVPVFVDEYKKEETTNFEIGMKSDLFDGKALLSLSGFYTDYKNQQIFIFDLATASQSLINAPSSEILGLEVELSSRPVEGLDLNASFGYLDTKLKSFPALPSASVDTTLIPGNKIPLNTEYTFNFSAQYTHPITDRWSALGRIDVERRGKMYWQADNLDVQKAFNLVNLRAGVETDSLSVMAYAKNLFDKKYLENYFPSEWIGFIDLSYPSNNRRQFGVEASYRF